jgi:hypothetical protein
VAARDEPRRELLGEGLEAPVARGHAPRSQYRDPHLLNDEVGTMNDELKDKFSVLSFQFSVV